VVMALPESLAVTRIDAGEVKLSCSKLRGFSGLEALCCSCGQLCPRMLLLWPTGYLVITSSKLRGLCLWIRLMTV